MGLSTSMGGSAPPVSNENAHVLLEYVRIGAPIFLLVVFIIAFIANSVVSAKRLNKTSTNQTSGMPMMKLRQCTQEPSRDLDAAARLMTVNKPFARAAAQNRHQAKAR